MNSNANETLGEKKGPNMKIIMGLGCCCLVVIGAIIAGLYFLFLNVKEEVDNLGSVSDAVLNNAQTVIDEAVVLISSGLQTLKDVQNVVNKKKSLEDELDDIINALDENDEMDSDMKQQLEEAKENAESVIEEIDEKLIDTMDNVIDNMIADSNTLPGDFVTLMDSYEQSGIADLIEDSKAKLNDHFDALDPNQIDTAELASYASAVTNLFGASHTFVTSANDRLGSVIVEELQTLTTATVDFENVSDLEGLVQTAEAISDQPDGLADAIGNAESQITSLYQTELNRLASEAESSQTQENASALEAFITTVSLMDGVDKSSAEDTLENLNNFIAEQAQNAELLTQVESNTADQDAIDTVQNTITSLISDIESAIESENASQIQTALNAIDQYINALTDDQKLVITEAEEKITALQNAENDAIQASINGISVNTTQCNDIYPYTYNQSYRCYRTQEEAYYNNGTCGSYCNMIGTTSGCDYNANCNDMKENITTCESMDMFLSTAENETYNKVCFTRESDAANGSSNQCELACAVNEGDTGVVDGCTDLVTCANMGIEYDSQMALQTLSDHLISQGEQFNRTVDGINGFSTSCWLYTHIDNNKRRYFYSSANKNSSKSNWSKWSSGLKWSHFHHSSSGGNVCCGLRSSNSDTQVPGRPSERLSFHFRLQNQDNPDVYNITHRLAVYKKETHALLCTTDTRKSRIYLTDTSDHGDARTQWRIRKVYHFKDDSHAQRLKNEGQNIQKFTIQSVATGRFLSNWNNSDSDDWANLALRVVDDWEAKYPSESGSASSSFNLSAITNAIQNNVQSVNQAVNAAQAEAPGVIETMAAEHLKWEDKFLWTIDLMPMEYQDEMDETVSTQTSQLDA